MRSKILAIKMKVNLISLGCPKNLVDSEVILGKLGAMGYALTASTEDADIVIINTCSFIDKARRESYQVISRIISQKKSSQKLIVCGCLAQLERRKLFFKFPQVDALLGSADFYRIDEVIRKLGKDGSHLFSVNEPSFIYDSSFPRFLSTPPSYAYLKIAEGCSNQCSYCLIPQLRGKYRSREPQDIIKEARALADWGVKELILIAQDTTFYGWDLDKKSSLVYLLEQLEKIDKLEWIRILYTHPSHFTSSLTMAIANSKKICPYIDLPLQHTHNRVLAKMKRPEFQIARELIDELRDNIPGLTLRTTFMVGFPGEEKEHFDKLVKDVQRLKFEWLGVFTYSSQKDTPAYGLTPEVPANTKERRYQELMQLQQPITREFNEKRVGSICSILVDKKNEGHAQFQTPEIDGKIFFDKEHIPGNYFRARISLVKNCYDLLIE